MYNFSFTVTIGLTFSLGRAFPNSHAGRARRVLIAMRLVVSLSLLSRISRAAVADGTGASFGAVTNGDFRSGRGRSRAIKRASCRARSGPGPGQLIHQAERKPQPAYCTCASCSARVRACSVAGGGCNASLLGQVIVSASGDAWRSS